MNYICKFIQVHDSFQCRHFVFPNYLFISETLPNSSPVRFGWTGRDLWSQAVGEAPKGSPFGKPGNRWILTTKKRPKKSPQNGSVLVEGIWDPLLFQGNLGEILFHLARLLQKSGVGDEMIFSNSMSFELN